MEIKWYGTATIEYDNGKGRLLVDPFVPLAGSKHQVDISEYDGCSDILITHGHFDHIVNVPAIIRRNPTAYVYCTKTPYSVFARKGVPKNNLRLLEYGDKLQINGFNITVYHGKHAVLPKASFRQLSRIFTSGNLRNLSHIIRENRICVENDETLMYLIEADGKRVLHMGSMNLRNDVEYPTECDCLMLPYNGWEDNFPPAKMVIDRLKPRKVILHHFDNTFPPITSEPMLELLMEEYGGMIETLDYREVR